MQEAKLRVIRECRDACAQVGVSLAVTGIGAGEVAKGLVVMLRTLAPAVTDVVHMQTDSGATTAIETMTVGRKAVTLVLVLVMWAVIHFIAAHIQGKTVAWTWQGNTPLKYSLWCIE